MSEVRDTERLERTALEGSRSILVVGIGYGLALTAYEAVLDKALVL